MLKYMKTQIFAILLLSFSLNPTQTNATTDAHTFLRTSDTTTCTSEVSADPTDIKVVVSQKRIWLVADEMPMKCLKTLIKNQEGKIVLEKCFSSKGADWFLNIEELPKGEYTLHLGADRVEKFKK